MAHGRLTAGIPVAFVGTYGPRRCGIATFTADLAAAVVGEERRVAPMVLAMTEPAGEYQYPSEVKFEIRQNVKADYARAAQFVNYSNVRLACVQHEHGIFGGDDGGYILDLVRALRVPAVVTLHTVLKRPSQSQATIVRSLAEVAPIVVMSQVAKDLLETSYGICGSSVRVILHGIPTMDSRCDRQALKAQFGVAGRLLLLTFGLLSPNKGIETVIRALPALIRRFPHIVYFVVGATHPHVVRREGEAYRAMLEREAEKLGVRDHVVFRGQFVTTAELQQYLQAADVFISPYLNEAQVTSGALSYAMGAGAAVVSTPYWHAQELLAGGRGYLFPFNDHGALAQTLGELLSAPVALARARDAARGFASTMSWPKIGDAYFEIFRARADGPGRRRPNESAEQSPLVTTLPELCLDHLVRLTDDTGIIQHATYSVPARRTGYCVDDNARALIVAVSADRICGGVQPRALVTRYLAYLHGSQLPNGSFCNFMSYERVLDTQPASDDCIGRAIWALGIASTRAANGGCRMLAREMLGRALPHATGLGPRGTAQAVLGLVQVLAQGRRDAAERALLDALVANLVERFRANATDDWRWFESTLTYDNALLPFALFAAYAVTGDRSTLRDARESLDFLEAACFDGEHLQLVGNTGWHSSGCERSYADEQPIDAAAFVLAFSCAYSVTNDRHYLQRMRESFAWFLGANRLNTPLYDFATGGCRDGIGPAHVNQNQGAESTLCFLMALLEMLEVDGNADTGRARESPALVSASTH